MNGDFDNLTPDAELDAAIHRALRVDSDPQQFARLRTYWSEQSQHQLQQRKVTWAAFALAAAAALMGVALFVIRQPAEQPIQLVRDLPRLESSAELVAKTEDIAKAAPSDPEPVETPREDKLAGRAPTTLEQAIFHVRSRTVTSPKTAAAKMDLVLHKMASRGENDSQQLLATAGLRNSDAETALLRKLAQAPAYEQPAIFRLLAVCGSRRSVSTLLQSAAKEAVRAEALAAVEAIVGLKQFPQLVANTRSAAERRLLLEHLLSSPSDFGRAGYLSLVRNERTRAEALAVAKATSRFPSAEFVALLDHPEDDARLSAAMLLGHVIGPETTRQLIARVTAKPADSTEVWMALIACRGELAQQFLADATHRPQMLAHFNSARVRWAQVIQSQPNI